MALFTTPMCDARLQGLTLALPHTPLFSCTPTATVPQPYCVYYPQEDQYFYLYQRYPNFPNLVVEVRGLLAAGGGLNKSHGRSRASGFASSPLLSFAWLIPRLTSIIRA